MIQCIQLFRTTGFSQMLQNLNGTPLIMPNNIITFAHMQIVLTLGVAQAFFAAFALLTKRPLRVPDKLLSGWLIAIGLWFTLRWVQQNYTLTNFNLGGGNLLLAVGPFMYLYSYYLINAVKHFKVRDLLHFLPPLFFSLLTAFAIDRSQKLLPEQYFFVDENLWFRILFSISFLLSIILYLVYTFRLLHKHESTIEDYFSSHSEKYNLKWVKYLHAFFSVVFLIIILMGVTKIHYAYDQPGLIQHILNICFLAFTYAVSLFGFRQGYIYEGKVVQYLSQSPTPVVDEKEETPKYEKSGLKENTAYRYLNKITDYMISHQPWRNSDLTIQVLSDQLEIPKHHITQTINSQSGKNFYQFVNEYRLEAVKKMLVDAAFDHWSILGIALECGFNSKSSFNTFFKQQTGVTPSEYRKANK